MLTLLVAVGQEAKIEGPYTFGPSNDTESIKTTPKIEGSTTIKKERTTRAKETKPRVKKPKNVEGWISNDSLGRSLYIRPSDGKLVYLECCFPDCGKTNFKDISSLKRHLLYTRGHNVKKDFFRNHAHIIEVYGKLPPERQAVREEEERYRLIEPYPHQEQIAYESEPSILVSSLRQPATAYAAVEQDSDGPNSHEATSITSPTISGDTSVTSITPIMARHDVSIKKEAIEDVDSIPQIPYMAQGKSTITHGYMSANEIERIPLPKYVSSMNYDTDDDDMDTVIHEAIHYRATTRPQNIPELASLNAGQMSSVLTHPEVQVKRECKSIERELFAKPVTVNVAAGKLQETDLADTSLPFGTDTLVGDSEIDAGLLAQPATANIPTTDNQETDGRITDTAEVIENPELETEHADTSIPSETNTFVGETDILSKLFNQPLTVHIPAATQLPEAAIHVADTTALRKTVVDSLQAAKNRLVAQTFSTGRARTTGPELRKGVSHKRASPITLARLDTAAQKRWRCDDYTFGPSSC